MEKPLIPLAHARSYKGLIKTEFLKTTIDLEITQKSTSDTRKERLGGEWHLLKALLPEGPFVASFVLSFVEKGARA